MAKDPPAPPSAPGSTASSASAARLWGEMLEGTSGASDVASAAERAGLSPAGIEDALALLVKAKLVEEGEGGYTRLLP